MNRLDMTGWQGGQEEEEEEEEGLGQSDRFATLIKVV